MEGQHLLKQDEEVLSTFNPGEAKMETVGSVTAMLRKDSELQMGSLNPDCPAEDNAEPARNSAFLSVKEMKKIGNEGNVEDEPARNSAFLSVKEMKKIGNQDNVKDDAAIALSPGPEKLLKIVMSTSFKEEHDKFIKQYYSRGPKRGLVAIFCYSEFLTGPESRDVESDWVLLEHVFKALHLEVIFCLNLTKQDTLITMKELPTEGFDSVFIMVSSHGFNRQGQWGTEFNCHLGEICTLDVVDLFSNEKRPELRGVPKVFVFQMCRGSKELSDLKNASKDSAVGINNESRTSEAAIKCKSSDVLIAYSTLPGYESIRNENGVPGSLYMQALCEVFASLAHARHVLDLFRILDARFKELCPAATTSIDSWGFGDLYLNPGLKEDAHGNPTPM